MCSERSCAINTGNPGDSRELCYIRASFILLNKYPKTGFLIPNCMRCFQSAQPEGDALEEITALILWGKTGGWTLLGPSVCPYALKVSSHALELCVLLVRISLPVFKFNIPSKFRIVTLQLQSKTSLFCQLQIYSYYCQTVESWIPGTKTTTSQQIFPKPSCLVSAWERCGGGDSGHGELWL